jgi:hypothetical protein
MRFLSSSQYDLRDDRVRSINLLNDGVLEKDLLETGLGSLLAERYFAALQDEVKKVVDRAVSFRPYAHPGAGFISAESAWSQFSPASVHLSMELKKNKDKLSKHTFDLLSQAYLQQKAMPTMFLKRVLLYQQSQASWLSEDPALQHADLSLFGLHTAEEWLGEKFLNIAAQFILNAAAYAETLGYSVSNSEAKTMLMQNLQTGIQAFSQELDTKNIDPYQVFAHQVHQLGYDEKECIEMGKKIALFRKFFQEGGQAIVLDPLLFQEFNAYAKQEAKIENFALPASLQFRDFTSCLKLQVYLEAVSNIRSDLSLPKDFLSVTEIEKRAPELVQKDYVLEFAEADLKKVASQISIKETWAWQIQQANWDILKKEFPILAKQKTSSNEERFAILESLEEKIRSDVDRFSRESLLRSNPQRLKDILHHSSFSKKSIGVSSKSSRLPFKGVQENSPLFVLLDQVGLGQDLSSWTPQQRAAQEKLSFYTDDGQHFYEIHVLERKADKNVLTFAEAHSKGILDRLLDKRLEEVYPEARKKDALAFMEKDGSWKPLQEVRDKVGMYAWSDLLKAISSEYRSFTGKEPSEDQKRSPEFYARHRLLLYMVQSLEHLKLHPNDSDIVRTEGDQERISTLADQWKLEREIKNVPRSKKEFFATEEAFSLQPGHWSSILIQPHGMLSFHRMLTHENAKAISIDDVERTKGPLLGEMQKHLMIQILDKIQEKQAIHL